MSLGCLDLKYIIKLLLVRGSKELIMISFDIRYGFKKENCPSGEGIWAYFYSFQYFTWNDLTHLELFKNIFNYEEGSLQWWGGDITNLCYNFPKL